MFAALTETLIVRDYYNYDGTRHWVDNAVEENVRISFHAIFTNSSAYYHDFILKEAHTIPGEKRWDLPNGKVVSRTANDMAESVSCLLKNSRKIVLIDPYFLGSKKTLPKHSRKWLQTLEAFCKRIPELHYSSEKFQMEYICSADLYDSTDFKVFKRKCEAELPSILPKGLKLRVKRYTQGRAGQKLHNRYILTDIGGVSFQHGLDGCEVDVGQTDDVYILDKKQYLTRWGEYVENPVFNVDGVSFEITGVKNGGTP